MTRAMVRVHREFGVRLSGVGGGRLLRKLGLSPQRPLYRAWQQTPRRWHAGRPRPTPAPRPGGPAGRHDLLRRCGQGALGLSRGHHLGAGEPDPGGGDTGDRFGVNLISAVTAKGALRFAAYDGSLNGVCSSISAAGCSTIARVGISGPGWPPGAPLEGRQAVRRVHQWAATAVFLPGCAPELNPAEWVWKNSKHDRIGRAGVNGLDDLKAKALAALYRLQKLSLSWAGAGE